MLKTVNAASHLEPAMNAQSVTVDIIMTSPMRLNASLVQKAHLPSKKTEYLCVKIFLRQKVIGFLRIFRFPLKWSHIEKC